MHGTLEGRARVGSPTTKARFSVRVLHGSDPAAEAAKQVEAAVFSAEFGLSVNEVRDTYSPWDANSDMLVMTDLRHDRIAGVARLVIGSPLGIPTLNDIEEIWGLDPDTVISGDNLEGTTSRMFDLATLMISEEYRGPNSMVTAGLHRGVYLECVRGGANWLLSMLDQRVFDLGRAFGIPWRVISDLTPRPHLGSVSTTPVVANLDGVEQEIFAHSRRFGEMLCRGRWIDRYVDYPLIELGSAPASRVAPSLAVTGSSSSMAS